MKLATKAPRDARGEQSRHCSLIQRFISGETAMPSSPTPKNESALAAIHFGRSIARKASASSRGTPSLSSLFIGNGVVPATSAMRAMRERPEVTMNSERMVTEYLDAWNDSDPARRRATLERLCSGDCTYIDPMAEVIGPAGLDALISGVQTKLAGLAFTLAGQVDAHHGQARFTWHAAPAGAREPVVIGFDVLVLDGERIRAVYGFSRQGHRLIGWRR